MIRSAAGYDEPWATMRSARLLARRAIGCWRRRTSAGTTRRTCTGSRDPLDFVAGLKPGEPAAEPPGHRPAGLAHRVLDLATIHLGASSTCMAAAPTFLFLHHACEIAQVERPDGRRAAGPDAAARWRGPHGRREDEQAAWATWSS
ncbi:MAG: hypothetical protein U0470_08900 [Anaerolineae bacterium]